MLRVRPEELLVGCLVRRGGESWGAKLSCVGCCCGHEHPGRYVLHHRHIFDGVFFELGLAPAVSLVDPLGTKGGECVDLV